MPIVRISQVIGMVTSKIKEMYTNGTIIISNIENIPVVIKLIYAFTLNPFNLTI